VTAVGCSDGNLRIKHNDSRLKCATVSLDEEIPARVLITRRWGFIVVKTDDSVFVFTVNGTRVAKLAIPAELRLWTSYYTREGFDFVLYQGKDLAVAYFEAGNPGKQERVDMPVELCGMSYDWRQDVFIFVTKAGKLIVYPRVKH
jgi:hypothetical protein